MQSKHSAYEKQHQLAAQLSHRMLIIYLKIFVMILIMIMVFLLPVMFFMSVRQRTDSAYQIYRAFENMTDTTLSQVNGFSNSPQLGNILQEYRKNPSDGSFSKVNLFLQTYAADYDNVQCIVIEDKHGTVFRSIRFFQSDLSEYLFKTPSYQKLLLDPSGMRLYHFSEKSSGESSVSELSDSFAISKNFRIGGEIYTITLLFKVNSWIDTIRIIKENNFSDYYVLKDDGILFTSGDADDRYDTGDDNHDAGDNSILKLAPHFLASAGNYYGTRGVFFYNTVYQSDCKVIAFASWYVLLKNFFGIFVLVTVLFLLSPVLYNHSLKRTVNEALTPLKELTNVVSRYSVGETIEFHTQTSTELDLLSNTFSDMSLKIKYQLENMKQYERDHTITQYRLLTTQIDPHFVYNTMTILNALARKGDTQAVIDVNSNLIHILQKRLNTKISIFATVEDEVITLQQYQRIMDYRYKNSVRVIYDIDPDIGNSFILKNILQPLIENAYLHGLTNEDGEMTGEIQVSIKRNEKNVLVSVKDNGRGISEDALTGILDDSLDDNQEKIHIGLQNIHQRMEYIYRDGFSFKITSEPGKGTEILLTFPLSFDERGYYNPLAEIESSE